MVSTGDLYANYFQKNYKTADPMIHSYQDFPNALVPVFVN